MERIIKFRGQRIDNNEWVYGYYVCRHDRHAIVDQKPSHLDYNVQVKPESVGQYTGYKYMNGEEIYFGDLVKAPSGLVFEVVWHDITMSISLKRDGYYFNFNIPLYEKVGTIHTNPELLNNN
ncbi:MAG: YopX family protein [Melioribacteraceae bacterium]